ncbi:Asp-tRNA(Asn)/Glu-tRNA(Gln) amidotransferase subunit GatC [Mesoplasma coleopterae]|uniref:Aspartyl/glutamyl-tRNA amidotransferase subunit C n=1 Tax=Mesoplasma coleopterae TaxID=324078 RepID=A0A2K8P1T8_9MOLU|nr:glutamyl-tRNA amidotransferase [Mesoplasma coleopterae]ATZ20689.1 aspartyl/glutamyl-tRNA amidotransferase subunit C [Mesoplasma coleopterae]AVN62206.1 glutamyl-tRNA amidotransferase [Mesoplasma coleopterae]AVN62871.1 glutamyl-tRNA amidotransferase [Mesoplasma coleopterae]
MKDKKYYEELAQDSMLKFTEKEIDEIVAKQEDLRKEFEKVLKIDTTNVKPLFYPYDDIHTYLRDDNETTTIDQKKILANAPTCEGDFVTIKKVVK